MKLFLLGLAMALGLAVGTAQADFPRGTVSLDLRDADVRDVIWAFAKEHRLNVIIGEDVKGRVTVGLRNVSIRTAFTSILDNSGLGYRQEGDILRINTLETIKKNQAIEPLVTRILTVNYFTTSFGGASSGSSAAPSSAGASPGDDDLHQLEESLKRHLSGAAGSSVSVIPRTNSLVITDIASNVDRLVEMAKQLDVRTPQILIEAKIVEIDANYSRNLGITTSFNSAKTTNTQLGGGGSANLPEGVTVSPGTAGAVTAGPGGSAFDFFLRSLGADSITNLQIILAAAEQNGLARTLATPRVTTLNNKEAVVSSGQRIPFTTLGSVAAQGGTNLVATVQFVDAALELAVTPHATGDETIMMKVRASRNTADFDNTVFQNPTIRTREAINEVLVNDGDTILIGGIYTEDSSRTRTGTPFLQDIPVLGHLFQGNSKTKDTMELIFLITPRVVKDPSLIRPSAQASKTSPSLARDADHPVH